MEEYRAFLEQVEEDLRAAETEHDFLRSDPTSDRKDINRAATDVWKLQGIVNALRKYIR